MGNDTSGSAAMSEIKTAEEVLTFWFAVENKPWWFKSTTSLDHDITERFLDTYRAAADGSLDAWTQTPHGCLALVVVLDQFPLNMFREQPQCFATEAASRRVAGLAIEKDFDSELDDEEKAFLYMPYMHSENLVDQDRSVALFRKAGLTKHIRWAEHHRDIVRRFGRFPHRNAIIGRTSTPEEVDYLNSPEGFLG